MTCMFWALTPILWARRWEEGCSSISSSYPSPKYVGCMLYWLSLYVFLAIFPFYQYCNIYTNWKLETLNLLHVLSFFKPHPSCTSCTWVVLNHTIRSRLLWYIRETLDIIVCHRYSCVLGLWSRCFSHRGCRRFPLPFQCRSRLNRLLQFLLRLITNLQYKASKNIRFIL